MKKIFIRTLGCQMNVRDSEVVVGLLRQAGFALVQAAEEADVVILNTCSVRQHAEDKVWSEVGRIVKQSGRNAQEEHRKPVIGIIGCMAQNYQEQIFERACAVDFVVGPSDIHRIPGIIKKIASHRSPVDSVKIWETQGDLRPDQIYRVGYHDSADHAYVVISEGCSNACSYCVVPYVRGQLHHRSDKNILKEIEEAVGKGINRVTLLGQNVNAYQYGATGFLALLKAVADVKGLREFSFITSHPKDASEELFAVMQALPNLKKYLHLPVQSGSDRILKLMDRGYTRKRYAALAGAYRKIVKGGALTTDIIVGYPTEKEDDFMDTYSLVNDIQFDAAFIFKYSVRPHTRAASLADDVPKDKKEQRHALLLKLQKNISKGKR